MLGAVVETADEAVYFVERQGPGERLEDFICLYRNRKARLLASSAGDLSSLAAVMPAPLPDGFARILSRVLDQVRPESLLHRFKDHEGTDFLIRLNPMDERLIVSLREANPVAGLDQVQRLEKLHKDLEARFLAFLHAVPAAVYFKTPDGRYLLHSTYGSEFYGLNPEDMIGRTDQEIHPTDLGNRLRENDLAVMKAGKTVTVDEMAVLNGRERIFESIKFPVTASDGALVGLGGISLDVTEERQTMTERDAALALIEGIFEASSIGIAKSTIRDDTGRIVDFRNDLVNRAAQRLLRYRGGTLVGNSLLGAFPEARDTGLFQKFVDAIETSQLQQFEYRQPTAEGDVWLEVRAIAFRDGIVDTFSDITPRKKAEADLMAQERRIRTVLEQAGEAIVTISPGGLIESLNRAAQRVFGRDEHDTIGAPVNVLFSTYEAENLKHLMAGWPVEDDEAATKFMRLSGASPSGRKFPFDAALTRMSLGGRQIYILTGRDTTERELLQSQFVQTQKMASLGQMAATLTHELNQPLNVIRMEADMAIMSDENGTSPLIARFRAIRRQTQRMAEMIRHMRGFARKEGGRPSDFLLSQALLGAARLLEAELERAHIRFNVDVAQSHLLTTGFAIQVEQIVINLVQNARDAVVQNARDAAAQNGRSVKGDGPIGEISLYLAEEAALNMSWFTVRDTGGGVVAAHKDKIFDAFFTTKEEGKGTGLGLANVLTIVRRMGGSVSVENVPGGAEFRVTLPASGARAKSGGAGEAVSYEARPSENAPGLLNPGVTRIDARVFVVEDEKEAMEMVATYLTALGCVVETFQEGRAAADAFAAAAADIVITDLRMPGMDGKALFRLLRARDPRLPVIFVTGSSHIGEISDHLQDGNTALLEKPLDLITLGRKVLEMISDRQ